MEYKYSDSITEYIKTHKGQNQEFLFHKDIDHIFHAEIKTVKQDDNEERIIEGWASTEDIDRINDVVLAKAFKKSLKTYLKNPVLTYMHNLLMPIGRILEANPVTDKNEPTRGLFVKAQLDSTEKIIWQKVVEQTIRAFSFGFKILSWHEETKDNDGAEVKIRIIDDLELIEIALVSVPMNREALFTAVKAFEENRSTDLICEGGCKQCGKCLENYKDHLSKTWTPFVANDGQEQTTDKINAEIKAIVPFKHYPLASIETRWSFSAADGNKILGDPENPNWNAYKAVHTWYDPENDETRAGFKLPHHKTIDGSVKTVWRGVVAAFIATRGGRTPLKIPSDQIPGIQNHLKSHSKEFDRELGGKKFLELELKEAIADSDLDYICIIKQGLEVEETNNDCSENYKQMLLDKAENAIKDIENKIWEVKEKEIWFRIKDPNLFKEGSIRRILIKKDKPKIFALIGRLIGKTATSLQSLRFPKGEGRKLSSAKTWVKDHPEVLKQVREVDAKNVHILGFISPDEIIIDQKQEENGDWKYTVLENDTFCSGTRIKIFKVSEHNANGITFSTSEGVYEIETEKIGQSISAKNKKRLNDTISQMKQATDALKNGLDNLQQFMADHNGEEPKDREKPEGAEPKQVAELDQKQKEEIDNIKTVNIPKELLQKETVIQVTEISNETQSMIDQLVH